MLHSWSNKKTKFII